MPRRLAPLLFCALLAAGCGDLNLGLWTPDEASNTNETRAAVLIGAGHLAKPVDAAASGGGQHLYVADAGLDRVLKLDLTVSAGTSDLVWEVGNTGTDTLQFSGPQGIAVGPGGDVYVADTGNGRIQQLSADGAFVRDWGELQPTGCGGLLDQPVGVAVDGAGDVYVTDSGADRVVKFSSQGVCLAEWGGPGTGAGLFTDPADIAVDTLRDAVYVVDRGNRRVQVFGRDGAFTATFGSQGTADGQFQDPWGVALEADGKVDVSDRSLRLLQRFTLTRVFFASDGSIADELGALVSPSGLAVADGYVYVCEPDKARIRRTNWTSSGLQ